MTSRFVRLDEVDRPKVSFSVNGLAAEALEGDTVMVAVLNASGYLRVSEFGDGTRAGFCLMGACQDCWVWTQDGERIRACSTPVSPGLHIRTSAPEAPWSDIA